MEKANTLEVVNVSIFLYLIIFTSFTLLMAYASMAGKGDDSRVGKLITYFECKGKLDRINSTFNTIDSWRMFRNSYKKVSVIPVEQKKQMKLLIGSMENFIGVFILVVGLVIVACSEKKIEKTHVDFIFDTFFIIFDFVKKLGFIFYKYINSYYILCDITNLQ